MTLALSHVCPNCGRFQELTSAVTEKGKYTKEPRPQRGDFSLCIICGEWGVFDDRRPGGMRKPNMSEKMLFQTEPIYRKIQDAWEQTAVAMNKGKRLQ
jgi:hypothetical protein